MLGLKKELNRRSSTGMAGQRPIGSQQDWRLNATSSVSIRISVGRLLGSRGHLPEDTASQANPELGDLPTSVSTSKHAALNDAALTTRTRLSCPRG